MNIDVSKCKFYTGKIFFGGRHECQCYADVCEEFDDCYYKQLQQLKAEKDKYYQMTLDDEIQINELYGKLEKIKEFINDYGAMQSDADCGLPVGILQIINDGDE